MNGKAVWFIVSAALAMLTGHVYGQQFCEEAYFQWEMSSNGVVITRFVGRNTVVRIPPQIQGMPVIGIGDMAFWYNRVSS